MTGLSVARATIGLMTATARKRCSTCHEERDLADFARPTAAPDGLQARCRACSRAWFERNQETHKATRSCVDCGEDDIRVLEFDHVRGKKLANVNALIRRRYAWSVVLAEIAKCDLRCANCHRRVTFERAHNRRQRAWLEIRAASGEAAASRLEAVLTR